MMMTYILKEHGIYDRLWVIISMEEIFVINRHFIDRICCIDATPNWLKVKWILLYRRFHILCPWIHFLRTKCNYVKKKKNDEEKPRKNLWFSAHIFNWNNCQPDKIQCDAMSNGIVDILINRAHTHTHSQWKSFSLSSSFMTSSKIQ